MNTIYFWDRFQIYLYILLLGNSINDNSYNQVHWLTTTGAVKKTTNIFIFFLQSSYKLFDYQIDIPFGVLIQLWTYLYNVVVFKKEYRFTAIVGQRVTFFKHYNALYSATKWLLRNKNTNVFHISVTLIIKVLTEPKCS